ncbi:putative leader peptide [Streptomyces yerevanensis]|uniref:putative leader peptide n=1 Tax=Streptomyces yerevanensis TaxID=66378 RepID=UPI003CCC134C
MAAFGGLLRSALLTTRGHIDLQRVASAACRRPGRRAAVCHEWALTGRSGLPAELVEA